MANYINKLEFHNYLKLYHETKSKKAYEKIGTYFLLIAKNYLNKPCYINYSYDWKDDMISEAVLDMVRYIHNYDVNLMETRYLEKGKIPDPFSYFSTYARNGINRLLKERKKDNVLIRLPFIENMDKRDMSYE